MDGTGSGGDLAGLKRALAGIELIDDPQIVRLKSRDFFWYSPILKAELNKKSADLVAVPKDQDEALRVLGACAPPAAPAVTHAMFAPADEFTPLLHVRCDERPKFYAPFPSA